LFIAAPSHSGKYAVKAENAGGEAQCIADFIVLESESQAGMQTEQDLQMRTHVIFKDIREEKIQVKVLINQNYFLLHNNYSLLLCPYFFLII
jgi:hypothetical protein